jgi:2-methylaconitate cis-trans-isomerase PrpF
MQEIPATWMRGGTSKCWVFRRADLEAEGLSVDEVLLRVFGSPDHRQVDGVGGGTSTTSKAVILEQSAEPDLDVEYTFAQVGIDEAKVDWGSNCGNCSAVVASFAVREGWVPAAADETTVRVLNTNTAQVIVQTLPTPGGALTETATTAIPGVPFLGAPVRMGFVDPGGRSTGRLFPSGRVRDLLTVHGERAVEVTLVDAGAPVVAVPAGSFGLVGDESPATIDAQPELLARLDRLRREAAVAMGLVETPGDAARAVPKLALISGADAEGGTDLTVRMLSMGRVHPALPITGSVALTLAALEPGTVVHHLVAARPVASRDAAGGLRLGTPAGTLTTFVEHRDGAAVVGAVRTYRRLASGSVVLPDPPGPDASIHVVDPNRVDAPASPEQGLAPTPDLHHPETKGEPR